MSALKRQARQTREETNNELIEKALAPMRAWTEFTQEVQVPGPVYPAICTGRPELLRLTPATDLAANDVAVLYNLIGTLLETNMALQLHAQKVAKMSDELRGHLRGFMSSADRLEAFSRFQPAINDEDMEYRNE